MLDKCPGTATILQPKILLKKCPECGETVEMVSTDFKANCDKCGFTIYNDVATCVQWCEYARECVGDEVYERLKGAQPSKSAN